MRIRLTLAENLLDLLRVDIVLSSGATNRHCAELCHAREPRQGLVRVVSSTLAACLCAFLFSGSATAGGTEQCFKPRPPESNNASTFVAPESEVCRAFEAELNTYCGADIPIAEFTPRDSKSGLTSPEWVEIPLYDADGHESAEGFSRLQQLVWSRSITTYPVEREKRATRDVENTLSEVRAAHAAGARPRLDETSLDLVGHGRKEKLYRLMLGVERNPTSFVEMKPGKREPRLFLERAVTLATEGRSKGHSSNLAGGSVSGHRSDVLLFGGVPYFLTWTPTGVVLVYAAHLQPNRPRIPDEKEEPEMFILPQLRCMFSFHPTK